MTAPKMPEDYWLHARGCTCEYCTWERANGGDPLTRAARDWRDGERSGPASRMVRQYSEDNTIVAVGKAPYFWREHGSLGEEVEPPIVLLGSDPGDRCHDAVELYGFVQDGIVTVTRERRLPARDPFVIHVEPDYQADLLRQLTHVDAIVQEECGMGARFVPIGAAEFNAMQDVYREVATTGVLAYRQAWNDELDRVEIERINITGARYRESVRLEALGTLPWDHAAGESS